MKKVIMIFAFILLMLPVLGAKEYSVLSPPTISVMDFEVNMEEPRVEGDVVSRRYFGELINHTLVTVLIQKNNALDLLIPRDDYYYSEDAGDARYFPPLLKIFDKKYVETALTENNYAVSDLYTKDNNAFAFPDLDFIVLGNVFDSVQNKISLNVRLLNTYRGEELFSYTGLINKDMSNLYEVCDYIASSIISDILKNYCSQVVVRRNSLAPKGVAFDLFCQASRVRDNVDNTITMNDTYKKGIIESSHYWVLPGDYTVTVYNRENKAVNELPFNIQPREIKLIELEPQHFEVASGSLTITNLPPTESYIFQIKEKARDAEYIWEIGRDLSSTLQEFTFVFNGGVFDREPGETGPRWSYRSAGNELIINGLSLTSYDVTVTPVAESISKESITGIVKISSRAIETSDPYTVDLRVDSSTEASLNDFNLKTDTTDGGFQKTRITFIMNPAFDGKPVELSVGDGNRMGFLILDNIEKLVIEDGYGEAEWKELPYFNFRLEKDNRIFTAKYLPSALAADRDLVVFVDFDSIAPTIQWGFGSNNDAASDPQLGFFESLFGTN